VQAPAEKSRSTTASFQQVLVSADLGGAGLVALHVADHLRQGGHASRVWIPGDGPAFREAVRLGLEVAQYDPAPAFSPRRLKAGPANWRFGRRLRRYRPGIVHVHGPSHYGALRWAVQHSGLKTVAHVQIEETATLLRWAFRRPPDLIVTCAAYLVDLVRQALPERCQGRQRIEAVPNAVDTKRFFPAADKKAAKGSVGAPATMPLVLMLANLAPHKGQETAIRAVAHLKRQGIPVACWLAGVERGGATVYTNSLRRLIGELEVADRVHLLGPRNDAAELLRAADFFLLPSTHEGLPLSILEAQASQVPVLAAATAGIPEAVVNGETGFLIPAGDAAGYARCLAALLANGERCHQVARQACLRTTAAYNWQNLCRRVTELYDELLRADG
jgi:glycosyltransferase involved in cell wall biosynthesis